VSLILLQLPVAVEEVVGVQHQVLLAVQAAVLLVYQVVHMQEVLACRDHQDKVTMAVQRLAMVLLAAAVPAQLDKQLPVPHQVLAALDYKVVSVVLQLTMLVAAVVVFGLDHIILAEQVARAAAVQLLLGIAQLQEQQTQAEEAVAADLMALVFLQQAPLEDLVLL
jgi:hypothetical protein